jgi:hypothetical protein
MQNDMSQLAARAIYAVFNLMPVQQVAANDRDDADACYDGIKG